MKYCDASSISNCAVNGLSLQSKQLQSRAIHIFGFSKEVVGSKHF